MEFLKNYAMTASLLTGIIIGGVCGIVFGEKATVVKPIGDLFLNFIFVLIVPLILFSVSSAICNMKKSNMVKKVIGSIFLVFIFTSIVSALLAYIFTLFYNPLEGIEPAQILAGLPEDVIEVKNVSTVDMLVNTIMVPDFWLLFSKSNLLPLIIFSAFLGVATAYSGEKGRLVADFLDSGTAVILKMINVIMYAAPIGLGCYFADTVGRLGGQLLQGYMNVFILYIILVLIVFFGLNSIYAFISGGRKAFFAFWKNILNPALTAIATSSSAACIPVNIEASKRMGVPERIAETVIPLGTNIHKDGSIISSLIKIIFLLSIFGHELTGTTNAFMIIGVALLAATIMGAIPSGGMTSELLICTLFGFSPQMVGTLLVITTIIDAPATLLNSTGNVTCSLLVARLTGGKNWIENIGKNNKNE